MTQQDLKEYSKKLQDGLLKSDHTIKIASLPSPAMSMTQKIKRPAAFVSASGKLKPMGMTPGSTTVTVT